MIVSQETAEQPDRLVGVLFGAGVEGVTYGGQPRS
jgi:hypothetical protein